MAELAAGTIQFRFLRQGLASDLCEGFTVLVLKVDERSHLAAKSLFYLRPTASRCGQVVPSGLSVLNDPPLKFHLGPLAGIHLGPIGTANGIAFADRPITPLFIGLEQVVTGAHANVFEGVSNEKMSNEKRLV